jgi:membrane associated rhomboid family serine protease
MQREIESESKFIWKFVLHVLLTPFTLILVLFKKKEFKDVFRPISELFNFITEAKITLTLIITNIVMFIVSIFFSEKTFDALISYPSNLFSSKVYTLITSGFLHINLAHLLGNMLALFIFGRIVERKLGPTKMTIIYFGALLISGIFTSAIDLIRGQNIGGLGASGAIMGLVSAAILIDPFYFTYELILPLPVMVVGWLTIYMDISGILNPVNDGIGHFAHMGGFISIAILLFFMEYEERTKLKKGLIINGLSLLIAGLIYLILI